MTLRPPTWLQKVRRALSRSEWAVRLLGLPRTPEGEEGRGLILIQIDGLAREQLEKAISDGRMPFTASLLEGDEYRLLSCYSGIPSTTPAVQGELMYGVKCAVPSFQFRDHETGHVVLAGNPMVASRIEERLASEGEGLLKGGSSYGNVYSGGSEKSSFCAATLGLGEVLRKANPISLLIVLVLHIFVAVRMAALVAVESLLAAVDAFRGIIERRDLLRELRFAPKRVALCVLLREMVALGARVDAARGLRVVACNFVGYDEQSHHRGPDSLFAHWTLKGIDKAIRGIFRAAERSASRDYDVWLYSDHGQEPCVAFEDETGHTIHETVSRVFERHGVQREPGTVERPTVQLQRVILLGGRVLQKLLGWPGESLFSPVKVGAMGPVAHAYTPEELPDYRKADVAQDLVMTEDVAAVAGVLRDGSVMLWTDEGSFRLPDEAEVLVGRDHPFREELPDDLVRLAHHPDAGSLVLFGWRAGQPCVTFGTENGAHAGPAERETHAFALVPRDTRISVRGDGYVRPLDIRGAALHLLGRGPAPAPTPPAAPKHPRHVRVMTYNVHSCVGLDGKHSPERVARVIARYAPDVVALQELDVNRLRTGGVHQARRIARALEMDYHFHPSFVVEEEQYGNAVLSRLPMRVVKTGPLPGGGRLEPRGVLWVEVDFDGMAVQLLNTHFGLRPTERLRQVQTLIGQDWLGSEQCIGPLVVCGDLNSQPGSRVYVRLSRMLQDAQEACDGGAHVPTWMQLRRVDHIFSSPGMTVVDAVVPRTRLTRVTSDHYPVIADLEFSEGALRPD